MIDGLAFSGKRFHENQERAGDKPTCAICGKAVNTDRPRTAWVHVHYGGCTIVTEAEAKAANDAGHESADMYFFPVGPDCLRRHPELQPYIARQPDDEPGTMAVPGFGVISV